MTPGGALHLRPRFVQRRRWRWWRPVMAIIIVGDVIIGVAELLIRGWTSQAAIDVGIVPLFAGGMIMFVLLEHVGVTVQGDSLTVREFLRKAVTVPTSSVERV